MPNLVLASPQMTFEAFGSKTSFFHFFAVCGILDLKVTFLSIWSKKRVGVSHQQFLAAIKGKFGYWRLLGTSGAKQNVGFDLNYSSHFLTTHKGTFWSLETPK